MNAAMPEVRRETTQQGILFSIVDSSGPVAPSLWALKADVLSPAGRRAIPVLLSLLTDDRVSGTEADSILVPYKTLASRSAFDLERLGLPEPAPVTILIENDGLLTDPGFRFRYEILRLDGRPLMGWRRDGIFLSAGTRQWTLPDPLYSLLDRIDAFNATPAESVDERFRRWSEIRHLLPEDADVDEYLQGTQVGFASSFTLDVRAAEDGSVTFDPVLVRPRSVIDPEPEHDLDDPDSIGREDGQMPSLPEAVAQSLMGQFTRYSSARSRYALEGGWFVAVDEPLRQALQVVREMQQASPAERRTFASNPSAVLRERLSESLQEEELEKLFYEPPDYGQRVASAGVWKPKVLPFLKQAAEPWLPPEILGILIDGQEVRIRPEHLAGVRADIQSAIEQSKAAVEYEGRQIPANEETLGILDTLQQEVDRAQGTGKPPLEPKQPVERHVLLLEERDNLLELGYAPTEWKHREGEPRVPPGLLSSLKPHQRQGLEWLQRHWLDGSPGALLADDMGLGKTLQVLAFLLWMKRQPGFRSRDQRPILVVAPTGLLANWVDEHNLHLERPGLGAPLRAYGEGLKEIRREHTRGVTEAGAGAPVLHVSRAQEAAWVLTTYETLRDYVHSFGRVSWSVAVLDEAQKIKNPGALISEECKAVASKADFVIPMTGTPVENRLADLWSIVDTCQPGVLRDLNSFVRQYDTNRDPTGGELRQLKELITHRDSPPPSRPGLMLRRMKWQELRGLPEKHSAELKAEMPSDQATAYDAVVAKARGAGKDRGGMLQALHHLRSVSLHPRPLSDTDTDDRYIAASARLEQAFRVLDGIAENGERALIFLESRDMQPILQGMIQRRYSLDHPPMVINGSVAGDSRKQMVKRFQKGDGFDCMILSPKAGGVGLTLTSANHVIHLSRWWNPAVEDQCTDRIYRIGQEKPVYIHIPLAIHPRHREHSFDVKLHALLERKRSLSMQVLGLAPSAGGRADLDELYGDTVIGTA